MADQQKRQIEYIGSVKWLVSVAVGPKRLVEAVGPVNDMLNIQAPAVHWSVPSAELDKTSNDPLVPYGSSKQRGRTAFDVPYLRT